MPSRVYFLDASALVHKYSNLKDSESRRIQARLRSLRNALLNDVSKDRIISSYELKRRHFEDIEEIFIRDHQLGLPRNSGDWLSSHDALIISMATEFADKHRSTRSDVVIVTCDRRISDFCAHYRGEFATAVCALNRDIV